MQLDARITQSISDVEADEWNRLLGSDYPFLQHDFLLALEEHDCLDRWGWHPVIFQLRLSDDLVGACACYIKDNSYGEFVFDWAWADAYQRNGLDYYPKLVTSIPYTPAQGPRLLVAGDDAAIRQQLIKLIVHFCNEQSLSSAHLLFCEQDDMDAAREVGLLTRFDYQYHWHNRDYQTFDDFLGTLNSKRRKNIRRERRLVTEQGIEVEIIPGTELDELGWKQLYDFYCLTFMRKSGTPTFTLEFFKAVARHLLAVFARSGDDVVAGAVLYRSGDTLYGRHWGCYDHHDNLHFEVCYYAGIDYCIEHGIRCFEPGAQGEHKIWRGFLPVKTESAHWVADERFRAAISEFLQREAEAMTQYGEQLEEATPYRQS